MPLKYGKSKELAALALTFAESDCLIWPNKTPKRPMISIGSGLNRVAMPVARWICEQTHGPAPSIAHQAAHNCGNMFCVNPRHIEWKTCKQNHADRDDHGRTSKGDRHPKARITSEIARDIKARLDSGQKVSAIVKDLNINRDIVADIKRGKTWSWLFK